MTKRCKTVQKAAHPKCMHPTGVLRRQSYGRSIRTFCGKSIQVAASLKCLMHAAWGKNRKSQRTVCSCRTMLSLES